VKITGLAHLIGAGILALLLVALAGCSTQSQQRIQTSSLAMLGASGDCAALLSELTQQIGNLGIEDPLAYPIKEYPYLRVNRLLESFTHQLETEAQSQAWYQQLYRLGQQARGFELNNLFPAVPLATRSQI